MLVLGMVGRRRVPMSITDQFWQYAKEAMLSAQTGRLRLRSGPSICGAVLIPRHLWRYNCLPAKGFS
jgi:hypothetical protein